MITKETGYELRNKYKFINYAPKNNKFGNLTFQYIFPKLLNSFLYNYINLNLKQFKNSIFNNINLIYNNFSTFLINFDVKYKKLDF